MRVRKTQILLLSLTILLSGCGFKLRGTGSLPAWFNQIILVDKNTDPYLLQQLTEQFRMQAIEIMPDIKKARFLLVLEEGGFQQQLTSVSASTTPRQYQLIFTQRYSLISSQGVTIHPSASIMVVRQITINNDRILGSNYEEITTKHEMLKAAAAQLINQIAVTNAH